jgi:hypothetical protein
MQLATQIYKKKGGGYSGKKPSAKTNKLKKSSKTGGGLAGRRTRVSIFLKRRLLR